MDPDACLKLIESAEIYSDEWEEACANLWEWLITKRGFTPKWWCSHIGTWKYLSWIHDRKS